MDMTQKVKKLLQEVEAKLDREEAEAARRKKMKQTGEGLVLAREYRTYDLVFIPVYRLYFNGEFCREFTNKGKANRVFRELKEAYAASLRDAEV